MVPIWEDRPQPLATVYRRSACLPAVAAVLVSGQRRMTDLLDALQVLTMPAAEVSRHDPQGASFFNVNTPADLAAAERFLAQSGP